MKILFVSGNLTDGGAQRVISIISSELANRGHNVSLLLFSRNDKEYIISSNVNICSLASNYQEYSKISVLNRIFRIRVFLKKINPDVAIGFLEGGYGLFLASIGMSFSKIASARIKPEIIMSAKGLRGILDRLWFKSADAVVLQNNEQKKQAPAKQWKNCVVIPNPVSREALETIPYYNESVERIVMVGRLAKQKNYEMMIAVMKALHKDYPMLHLDIYGKGKLEEFLNQTIQREGLSDVIHLRGWTQNAIEEYKKSDLFVLSSNYEGMPNALIEAMAVGIPCISTECETGPKELIDNGNNGFLVPTGNIEKMIEIIRQVISLSKEERERVGHNAKTSIASRYTISMVTNQWESLLNTLDEGR